MHQLSKKQPLNARRTPVARRIAAVVSMVAAFALVLYSSHASGDDGDTHAASAPRAVLSAHGFTLSSAGAAPRTGRPWRMTVKGSAGQVSLDVLAFGKVAAHISSGDLAGGSYSSVVNWPAKAAGYDMVVRATITSAGGRTVLTQPVKPRL